MLEKLTKLLPKQHHNRVEAFYREDGLIDGCKYMLELAEPYVWHGDYTSLPCRTIAEAAAYVKEAEAQ